MFLIIVNLVHMVYHGSVNEVGVSDIKDVSWSIDYISIVNYYFL